jgi:hypothetical protein
MRVLERLFTDISPGANTLFWTIAAELTHDEVLGATLDIDLNFFAGAWRYGCGGSIARIHESTFTARELVAGVVKAMAKQYVEAMALVDPARACVEIVLAGGVPRRIPSLNSLLNDLDGRPVVTASDGEETLSGLARLAETLQ